MHRMSRFLSTAPSDLDSVFLVVDGKKYTWRDVIDYHRGYKLREDGTKKKLKFKRYKKILRAAHERGLI